MKISWFGFVVVPCAMLILGGCSEDYDPSASAQYSGKTEGQPIQGKEITDQSEPKGTNESLASKEPGKEILAEEEPREGNESNGSTKPNDPLIGQTLPSLDTKNTEGNATTNAAPPSRLPPLPKDSPYQEVSFRSISSFPYEVEWETDGKEPDPTAYLQRVPREVRKLGGTKVAVEGFMIPTMVNEDNKVTEFLLLPDQMSCCYGKNPAANGWVVVTSQGTDIMMDQMIRVTGSLVVEERWDEEFFVGLYHLSCENVTGPAL